MSKYLHHSKRLDFTSRLLATDKECEAIDVPSSTLEDMLCADDIKGLESLVEVGYGP